MKPHSFRKATLLAKLFIISVAVMFAACENSQVDGPNNGGENKPSGDGAYEDIEVVNGMVRFYLEEKANATRTASGIKERNWSTSRAMVNGKSYSVQFTDEQTPRPYIEVAASASDTYNAVLLASGAGQWYESSTYTGIRLIHSQIYHMSEAHLRSYPMYANYAKETGNRLIFNDGYSMIILKLNGNAKISSVKVENPLGKSIAGLADITPSKGYFSITKGMNFAVMNCTNRGNFVQLEESSDKVFRLMIAPGEYSEGLKFSICDSERGAMFFTTSALTLGAGEIHTIERNYESDPDILFYEGFDNFVWGGDVMKGEKGYGFSPAADEMRVESGVTLSGYEVPLAEVAYDNPGSGFIQSNNWNLVSGLTVGESHQMSDEYVASRNIADMGYMFRTQEHPGYVAVGTATQDRGILQTSLFSRVKTISRAKLTIDFALQAGFNGELLMQLINGGVFESATLNGQPLELTPDNLYFRYETASCKLFKEALVIPSTQTEPQAWNRLELSVNGVTDGTKLYIADNISAKGVHGIYLDRIEVREVEEWGKKDGTLRVLLWNILAGMWTDQHNNYDNLVEWVKKYDPDVCIWTESETIYYDNSKDAITDKSQCYLPDGWAELGARFGHNYMAVSGNRDNYPQTVTSKYPINIVQKITDTHVKNNPVVHGAGHFTIEVNGKKLNIVTLHMWPMDYFFGTSTSDTRGDYYREFEMQYIVDQTINNPKYAGEEYWLLAGDTNAHSPLDSWFYGYQEDDSALLTHNVVRKQTNLKDVIGERYPENFFIETYPTHIRIDFIYLSPKMFDYVDNSIVLIDEWCRPRKNGNVQNWYAPADHRPVLLDLVVK